MISIEKYRPILERIRERFWTIVEEKVESRMEELMDALLSNTDLRDFTPKQIQEFVYSQAEGLSQAYFYFVIFPMQDFLQL